MGNLYRLNPGECALALVRQNPSRKGFDHVGNLKLVERDGVTVSAVDAKGVPRYGEGAVATGSPLTKAIPIALAALLGVLVVRKVRARAK